MQQARCAQKAVIISTHMPRANMNNKRNADAKSLTSKREMCGMQTGTSTSPQGRGPFQKFSTRKTRSGELPRRHSASAGSKDAGPPTSPQESGGSMPQPQATPFSHSNTWGPRAGPLQGAAANALASVGSGPLGPRAAPPSTPPQQPGGQPYGLQQVLTHNKTTFRHQERLPHRLCHVVYLSVRLSVWSVCL